jgi:Divergent InlB B-repeat domain
MLSLCLLATPFLMSAACNQAPVTLASSYSVNINSTGPGTITSSPAGITCGESCSSTFASDASITLTATPAANSSFTGWGIDCDGVNTTCTLTMTGNKNVKATFTANTTPTTAFALTPSYQNNAYFIAQGANALYEAKITNRANGFTTQGNKFDSLTATGSIIGSGAGKVQLEYRDDLSSADTLDFVLVANPSTPIGEYEITLEATAGSDKASVKARVQVTPCSFGCQ